MPHQNGELHPFISVIVPAYNDHQLLPLCLDALERQSYPAECYEVIVVDNGSRPPLDEIVSSFRHAVLIRESKRGSYAARNAGIATARGDYLAFTDSDCIPEPDWLEKGVSYLRKSPDCGLVGGRVEVFPATDRPTGVELFEMVYAFQVDVYIRQKHYAPTCNLFTIRAVFDRVGLFDAELPSGGDTEWGQRVYAAGYSQIYAQDVAIRHPARRTLAELTKKYKRIAAGRAIRIQSQKSFEKIVSHPLLRQGIIPRSSAHFIGKLRESGYSPAQKLQVLSILAWVYFISIAEKFRRLFTGARRD